MLAFAVGMFVMWIITEVFPPPPPPKIDYLFNHFFKS